MELKRLILISLILSIFIQVGARHHENSASNLLELNLNPDKVEQIIHNFGASDAWACQFVGKNWPLEKRQKIADLLFSTEIDSNGNPIGIGLSAWRFNIGAGSAEQGENSDIEDEWRRAECFMDSTGTYNWNRQKGQRWFLQAAKKRGVNQFIGFVNSPPVHLTKNGKAYSSGGNSANLSKANFKKYAAFLTKVIQNIGKRDNIHLDYISPFNEPQWDWSDPTQEGSPWKNSEIHKLCCKLDSLFSKYDIDSKIEIPETAQNKYLYMYNNKPERGNQIEAFFRKDSPNYLGDLNKMPLKIAGHSYFSTYPDSRLIRTREEIQAEIDQINPELEYWMTEYCILENNKIIQGKGRKLGMQPALYMAKVIHADLTIANACAWQWWLGISPYDYKDGLVYIDKNMNNGDIYESKMLWALGHYSRFIRPGMRRIKVNLQGEDYKSDHNRLLVSAYKKQDKQKYVIVIINQGNRPVPIKINSKNISESSTQKLYQTTPKQNENLAFEGEWSVDREINISPKSLVTLVIK